MVAEPDYKPRLSLSLGYYNAWSASGISNSHIFIKFIMKFIDNYWSDQKALISFIVYILLNTCKMILSLRNITSHVCFRLVSIRHYGCLWIALARVKKQSKQTVFWCYYMVEVHTIRPVILFSAWIFVTLRSCCFSIS